MSIKQGSVMRHRTDKRVIVIISTNPDIRGVYSNPITGKYEKGTFVMEELREQSLNECLK